jgi:hypothetical protein
MRKIHCLASTLFILLLVAPLQAQNPVRPEVPIANISGAKLRSSPSMKAKVVKALGVGDSVLVIRKMAGDSGNGTKELWAFVQFYRSMKGASDTMNPKGWVLDKDLGYQNRFKKITAWKPERTSGALGDYWFTMEVRKDGSFVHRYAPCVDCGEKPDCGKGERKVGSECVSRGHLYGYGNFVWAKKPTRFQEYFFINKRGNLQSVYPEDK